MRKRLACALPALLLLAAPAMAQLVASSDEPVDITGDTAEFKDNLAIWTGNVRVVQGESILTAARLEAELDDAGDFDKIYAFGTVRYSNGAEAITGEEAVFDSVERTITMSRNVILTQGKQVLSAGSVIYWVDTGRVKLNPADGSRIRGIFYTDAIEEPA
ncbi:MAG: LptA/OstA family protein [Pseudomonadota bacterium]